MPLPSDLVRSRTTPSSSHEALKSSCACAVLSSCTPSTTFERLQADSEDVKEPEVGAPSLEYLLSSTFWGTLVCATRSPADWGPGTVQAQVVYKTQALPRVRLVRSPRCACESSDWG